MTPLPSLTRRTVLAGGGAALAAAGLPALLPTSARAAGRLAPGFVGIDGWLNSPPLTMAGLRGRVVMVTFFARSCINCIHAMPYIESWQKNYGGRGFTVVAIHTPEFEVEKSRPALEAAAARFGLTYPIAEDNNSATWNAWDNQYWPAEYLVDQHGRIVHTHFGEGGYAETEGLIRRLLG